MFNETTYFGLGLGDIAYKSGVSGEPVAAIQHAIDVASSIYSGMGKSLTVTSIRDSTHMKGSLHYSGRAVDLRTSNLTSGEQQTATSQLRSALPYPYQVILESNHIHVEWEGQTGATIPAASPILGASASAGDSGGILSSPNAITEFMDTPFLSGIPTVALVGVGLLAAYFFLK